MDSDHDARSGQASAQTKPTSTASTVISEVGPSQLKEAVKSGNLETAQYLLEQRVDVNVDAGPWPEAPLFTSADFNLGVPMVRLLLNYGLTVDYSEVIENLGCFGSTNNRPEHAAIFKLLVDHGMPVDSDLLKTVAWWGNDNIVDMIVSRGVDVNHVDPSSGESLLHDAASDEDDRTAATLLKFGADTNARGRDGLTPLFRVAAPRSFAHGSVGGYITAQALLQSGALPNVRDEQGAMPLQIAMNAARGGAARALIGNGADISEMMVGNYGEKISALGLAMLHDLQKTVMLLLERGADVNAHEPSSGKTAVHKALQSIGHDPFLARTLIQKYGGDVSIMAKDGLSTGLHFLASTKIDQFRSPDPFPQSLSMEQRHEEIRNMIAFLIKQGLDVDVKNPEGQTPLMLAVKADNVFIVWVLIHDHNANVHATDNLGRTALVSAIHALDDIPLLLLLHGADAMARDEKGLTAREKAKKAFASEDEHLMHCLKAFEDDAEKARLSFREPEIDTTMWKAEPRWERKSKVTLLRNQEWLKHNVSPEDYQAHLNRLAKARSQRAEHTSEVIQ